MFKKNEVAGYLEEKKCNVEELGNGDSRIQQVIKTNGFSNVFP